MINKIKKIVEKKTCNMFSNEFYNDLSNELYGLLSSDHKNIGYVYLISNGKGGDIFKIGMASNLVSRCEAFSTAFENGVYIIAYAYCENFASLERTIHKKFSENKYRNEFFRLNALDINSLKNYGFVFVDYSKNITNYNSMIENVTNDYIGFDKENEFFSLVLFADRNYSNEFNDKYRDFMESYASDKRIFMMAREFAKRTGYIFKSGKDAKGRYFVFLK
jgi:hypothetical protein